MRDENDDLDTIREALRADFGALLIELRGEPFKRTRREWRWGARGSFSAVVDGAKAGTWYDHEAGEGGDALALIQRELSCDFPTALRWARRFVGMEERGSAPPRRPKPNAALPPPLADDEARRIADARTTWTTARPLVDSPAARYLIERRGIPAEAVARLAALDAARSHPTAHEGELAESLVVPVTDATGELVAVQRVLLGLDGRKLAKKSRGILAGAAWRIPGTGELIVTEGPEDAASCWAATGRPTWAALGSMVRLLESLPAGCRVTVSTQPQDTGKPAERSLAAAMAAAVARGVVVRAALPPPPHGDANDLIRAADVEAVRAMLDAAELVGRPKPTHPLPSLDVGEARLLLRGAIEHVIGEAAVHALARRDVRDERTRLEIPETETFPFLCAPQTFAIRADVGLGKSSALRELAPRLIEMAPGCKVVVAVPTVALADEAARLAREAGVRACAVRGREQPVPGGDGEAMCLDQRAAEDTEHCIVPVQSRACEMKTKNGILQCQHFHDCQYQKQWADVRDSDIVFMPHQYLFTSKHPSFGDVSLLVIDETFYGASLIGLTSEGKDARRYVSENGLSQTWTARDKTGSVDTAATAVVNAAFGKLNQAIWINGDGYLRRESLETVGLDETTVIQASRETWKLRLEPDIWPGMDARRRKDERGRVEHQNKFVRRVADVWRLILRMYARGQDECGNLVCGVVDHTRDGGDIYGARIMHRKDIHRTWETTTLVLDATYRRELVAPFFYDDVIEYDMPGVRAPYATVTQIVGAPVASGKLIEPYKPTDKNWTTVKNHQVDMHRFVRLAVLRKRRVLLVGQLRFIQAMLELGLPGNIETAHFNALAGLDGWGDVDALIVVGRTAAGPVAVEEIAAAMTGRSVRRSEPGSWYGSAPAGIALADGGVHPVTVDRHRHPAAEGARWRIAEGEVIQAVGRARAINRDARGAVDILIVDDVVLPLAVDEVRAWEAPSRMDEMAIAGMWLETPADMARAFPGAWATAKAAEHDKARTPPNAYKRDSLIGVWGSPRPVTYRLAGAGQKPKPALWSPALIADPAAWLADRLGPLALYEVVGEPTPVPVASWSPPLDDASVDDPLAALDL